MGIYFNNFMYKLLFEMATNSKKRPASEATEAGW